MSVFNDGAMIVMGPNGEVYCPAALGRRYRMRPTDQIQPPSEVCSSDDDSEDSSDRSSEYTSEDVSEADSENAPEGDSEDSPEDDSQDDSHDDSDESSESDVSSTTALGRRIGRLGLDPDDSETEAESNSSATFGRRSGPSTPADSRPHPAPNGNQNGTSLRTRDRPAASSDDSFRTAFSSQSSFSTNIRRRIQTPLSRQGYSPTLPGHSGRNDDQARSPASSNISFRTALSRHANSPAASSESHVGMPVGAHSFSASSSQTVVRRSESPTAPARIRNDAPAVSHRYSQASSSRTTSRRSTSVARPPRSDIGTRTEYSSRFAASASRTLNRQNVSDFATSTSSSRDSIHHARASPNQSSRTIDGRSPEPAGPRTTAPGRQSPASRQRLAEEFWGQRSTPKPPVSAEDRRNLAEDFWR